MPRLACSNLQGDWCCIAKLWKLIAKATTKLHRKNVRQTQHLVAPVIVWIVNKISKKLSIRGAVGSYLSSLQLGKPSATALDLQNLRLQGKQWLGVVEKLPSVHRFNIAAKLTNSDISHSKECLGVHLSTARCCRRRELSVPTCSLAGGPGDDDVKTALPAAATATVYNFRSAHVFLTFFCSSAHNSTLRPIPAAKKGGGGESPSGRVDNACGEILQCPWLTGDVERTGCVEYKRWPHCFQCLSTHTAHTQPPAVRYMCNSIALIYIACAVYLSTICERSGPQWDNDVYLDCK